MMSTIFLCFGVFVLISLLLGATLFNNLSAHKRDRSAAVACLIISVAVSSIITGLLAMMLGA